MMRLRDIKVAAREAQAMLVQAGYLARDLDRQGHSDGDLHVFMVHGLYASAGVFRPMRRAIEARLQVAVSTMSYLPGAGILELTAQLARRLQRLPPRLSVVLVGHSLGGLVARQYVRQHAMQSRVVQTISLATPFNGTHRHRWVVGQAGRDLVPGSPILAPLWQDSPQNRAVPHLSLIATDDQLVLGAAHPQFGTRRFIENVGHNGILFDDQAIASVLEQVAQWVNLPQVAQPNT